MMGDEMARKLVAGAAGALNLAADIARHLAWFVSHQIDRRPRERD